MGSPPTTSSSSSRTAAEPWYRKVLGEDLIQWRSSDGGGDDDGCGYRVVRVGEALGCCCRSSSGEKQVNTSDVADGGRKEDDVDASTHGDTVGAQGAAADVVGLYFPSRLGDDFTNRLVEFFERINNNSNNNNNDTATPTSESEESRQRQRLRIVQITSSMATSGYGGLLLDPQPLDVPWFAVPPEDVDRQRRLCRRYRVAGGQPVATLLLLEGASGRVITRAGRDRLLDDPLGAAFPWAPRPLQQVLGGAALRRAGTEGREDLVLADLQRDGGFIGLYFSAYWCPPCKAFTPLLTYTYEKVRGRGHHFEIIFISSDRSEASFRQFAAGMPWPALSWSERAVRQELVSLLDVQAIPTLVLLDHSLQLITGDGRTLVNDDPEGKEFPWRPQPLSLITERLIPRLLSHPAIILFIEGGTSELDWAKGVLKAAYEAYNKEHPLSEATSTEPNRLQFYIAADDDASDYLRHILVLEDAVPLLVAVDVCLGTVSVLEEDDEEEAVVAVTPASAVAFTEAFLAGDLPAAPIGVPQILPLVSNQELYPSQDKEEVVHVDTTPLTA